MDHLLSKEKDVQKRRSHEWSLRNYCSVLRDLEEVSQARRSEIEAALMKSGTIKTDRWSVL